MNKVELSPSLWLYAIHGTDEEIIHILEDNNVNYEGEDNNKKSLYLLKEAIKCHHNINNYIPDARLAVPYCLKYNNFFFLDNERINQSL